jgi:hypothetical protein
LITNIDHSIDSLEPASPRQARIDKKLRDDVEAVEQDRWRLIEVDEPKESWPVLFVLALWMVMVFLAVGLISPRNALVRAGTLITAISVASALYLILDLDTRNSGLIQLSSQPLRDALMHLQAPS